MNDGVPDMYQISKNHIAVPPGETIKEQLEIWEITKAEFLSRMGMTPKVLQ